MNNKDIIAKIKAEIERLKEKAERRPHATPLEGFECMGKIKVCNELISFLSTLESEKPMEQEGLEKEMNRYFNAWQNVQCEEDCSNEGGFCCVLNGDLKPVSLFHCRKIARHFAQWQKEQDEKEQADLFTIVALDAAQRAREQMMEDSVEVVVWDAGVDFAPHPVISVEDFNVKDGDKVRIIILPKED